MKRSSVIGVALFVLMAIIVIHKAKSATYYVDYQNGADTNNGLSTSAPFKHCPGDNNASGNAAAVNLSVGLPSKVIFRGGVQYKGTINLDWSGASDVARIVYQGNTDAQNWGNSKAVIDGEGIRYRGFYSNSSRSYLTIKNFEIRYMAQGATDVTSAIDIGSSGSNSLRIIIEDCYIHSLGNWNQAAAPGNNGIRLLRPIDSLINSNLIEKPGKRAIVLGGARNTTVSNNTINDYFCWGIDVYYHGQYHEGVVVKNNLLINGWRYDAGGCHSDYIYIRQGSPQTEAGAGRNAIVEGNILLNNAAFSDHAGTAMITVARSKNIMVRNNVLINPHSYYAMQLGWESWESGHKVLNNTIYAPRTGCWSLRISDAGTNPLLIKNNILIGYGVQNNNRSVSPNNNLYVFGQPNAWNWTNWTAWQNGGNDQDGMAYGNISDVKFLSITGYPTSCQNMNLSLQEGSPAIDSGANLSGEVDKDLNGLARPLGTDWDIGAYEFEEGAQQNPSSPLAPSGLRINNP